MASKTTATSTLMLGFCGGGILMLDQTLAKGLADAVAAGLKGGLQMGPDGKKRIRVDIKSPEGQNLLPTFTLVKEGGQEKFLLSVDVEAKSAKPKKNG